MFLFLLLDFHSILLFGVLVTHVVDYAIASPLSYQSRPIAYVFLVALVLNPKPSSIHSLSSVLWLHFFVLQPIGLAWICALPPFVNRFIRV